MKHTKFLALLLLGFSACDLIDRCNVECDVGAPEFRLELYPGGELDSSYLDIRKWKIYDGEEELRVQVNQDSTFEYNGLFMLLDSTESGIKLYGSGIVWNHLNDKQGTTYIDYGNEDVDTITFTIKEHIGDCCSSHSIDKAYFNGEELVFDSNSFSYTKELKK
ncbi:MAG: hypothetical protein RIC35_05995 [Marinoscillum sp.]